jgi:hypothetical protein
MYILYSNRLFPPLAPFHSPPPKLTVHVPRHTSLLFHSPQYPEILQSNVRAMAPAPIRKIGM